jgi:hypothetical protein
MPAMLARLGLLLVLVAAWPLAASAQSTSVLGRWTGTFVWEDEPDDEQELEIDFTRQQAGPDGTQRFIGAGTYHLDPDVHYEATLDLDPRTREIRMIDGDAPGVEDWVNDGVHVGTLSPDGTRIEARFVSKADGRVGRLVLTRAGSAPGATPPRGGGK